MLVEVHLHDGSEVQYDVPSPDNQKETQELLKETFGSDYHYYLLI